MLDADLERHNNTKLQELYPLFRVRVQAVLDELRSFGYRPRIQVAWRSPADQMDAYRRGASKVQYGYHNVTSPTGAREALAVDIWDDDRLEKVKLDFMLHLAAAAESQMLISGIRWDLSEDDSVLIDVALKNKNWGAKVRVGWDPLHVQVTGITIQDAKDGKRPDFSTPQTSPVNDAPDHLSDDKPDNLPDVDSSTNYKVINLATSQSADYNNWGTAFRPVTLLPVPYVSQLGANADAHKNDCGAACAVMLLAAYKKARMTLDEFYVRSAIQGDPYLSVMDIRNALGSMGVRTEFKAGLGVSDIFNAIAGGKPVIALLRYKVLSEAGLTEKMFQGPHFAVITGMDCKYVYVHDPLYTNPADGDAHPYPIAVFYQAWKEVALDPQFQNPERSAIIPLAGLGFKVTSRVKVNIPMLNIRSGPGLDNKIIGTLKRGQILDVTREINGWGEISPDRWVYVAYTLPVPQEIA